MQMYVIYESYVCVSVCVCMYNLFHNIYYYTRVVVVLCIVRVVLWYAYSISTSYSRVVCILYIYIYITTYTSAHARIMHNIIMSLPLLLLSTSSYLMYLRDRSLSSSRAQKTWHVQTRPIQQAAAPPPGRWGIRGHRCGTVP